MLTAAKPIQPTEQAKQADGDRCPSIARLAARVARWQPTPNRSTEWATQAANVASRAIRRSRIDGIHPMFIIPGGAEFRLVIDHGGDADAIADQMASIVATAGHYGLQMIGQSIDARLWEMRLQSISDGDDALSFFGRFRQSVIESGLIVVDCE